MSRPRAPDGADDPIARDRSRSRLLAARHALSRRLFRKAPRPPSPPRRNLLERLHILR